MGGRAQRVTATVMTSLYAHGYPYADSQGRGDDVDSPLTVAQLVHDVQTEVPAGEPAHDYGAEVARALASLADRGLIELDHYESMHIRERSVWPTRSGYAYGRSLIPDIDDAP